MTDMLGPRLGNSPLACLLQGIALARPGAALEFGVGVGTTLGLIADAPHLDPVVGFDSFKGLPEDWRPGWERGKFARKRPPNIPGTNLVIGWYADTLPGLFDHDAEHVPGWLLDLSFVHIDCDLYSSTVTVLEHLGPYFSKGLLLCFDEFHGYPGCEKHEQRAWLEYVEATRQPWEPVGHGPEQLLVRLT